MNINSKYLKQVILIWVGMAVIGIGRIFFYDFFYVYLPIGGAITLGSILHVLYKDKQESTQQSNTKVTD